MGSRSSPAWSACRGRRGRSPRHEIVSRAPKTGSGPPVPGGDLTHFRPEGGAPSIPVADKGTGWSRRPRQAEPEPDAYPRDREEIGPLHQGR